MRADDPDVVEIEGPPELAHPAQLVIDALAPIVTPNRLDRIRRVVAQRTDELVVVLDGIVDPHNASAVLRSADAFGVQTIHTVLGPRGFAAARGVSKGTHRWLDVVPHESPASCIETLRDQGYRVYVAAMGADQTPQTLRAVPRVAVVFGNEHRGVSEEMAALADGTFSIPMRGFVESLNVSVAAAITLQTLGAGRSPLGEAQKRVLEARFLMNSVKSPDTVIAQFLRNESEPRGVTN